MDKKGLTLIEVLIAVVISSVLILTLYITVSTSVKVMTISDEGLSGYREVSIVIDSIRREIESTIFDGQNESTNFSLILKDYFGRSKGEIRFVGLNSTSRGLFVIHYKADEYKDKLRLLKKVYPVWLSPENAKWEVVLDEIYSFSVLAYDGREFLKVWDSSIKKSVPKEIRFELQIKTSEGEEIISLSDKAVLRIHQTL